MGNSYVKRIVVTVVIYLAAFAKPSDPEDSEDDDDVSTETETDSSESLPSPPPSPEKPEPSNPGKNSPGIYASDNVEPYRAVCPESFTPDQHYSQINTPSNEYGVPGPPVSQYASTRDPENGHGSSNFHSHSAVSEDRLPSNDSNVSLHATQNGRSQLETSDLSGINLSVDARVCRLQRPRRPKAASSKKADKSKDKTSAESNNETTSIHEKGEEKQAEDDKAQKLKDDVGPEKSHTHDKEDEIMAFIRDFVNKTGITESKHLKFFDAAVVYDTADYTTVNNFITEVKAIVEPRLRESIRIELFDSVEFAQSKVLVVEDVIERCSVVFVYLTENCNQETFKLFCDEGIGITRLGLGMGGGARDHERKWVIKPVHTQPPKFRRYKTPVGLVSLQGIDWFDKDSDHTRDRLVYLMEHAVKQRKRKEGESSSTQIDSTILEQNILSSISNKPRNDGNQRKNNHFVEKPSICEDAMSFNSQPSGFAISNQASLSGQSYGYQEPPIHVQAPPMQVPAQGFYGQQPLSLQGYQFPTNPPSNQLLIQAANGHYYAVNQFGQPVNQFGQPQTYPGQQQMYQAPYLSQVQMSGHYPQQAHIPNPQQPLQQTSPYTSQAQMQNQYQNSQGHPLPLQQNVNVQPTKVQSAGVYQPQMQPQQHYQNNINNPSPVPNVPNHQIHPNYQPQAMRDQQQASSTQLDTGSATGDYMRDRRNDAPAESELSVVSRVTGKLIVNPNLSTDDIEIDDPSGRGEPECRPRTSEKQSKSGRRDHDGAGNPRSRQRTPSHNGHASSSDDSDTELPISKGKSKKDKVIHIYGCKNVQFGSDNKVIEKKEGKKKRRSTRKRSSETEAPDAVELSMNSLKFSEMKQTGTLMEEIHDSSRHARSTVHEDNLDMPSVRMEHTYQNTAGEPRPAHDDEARNCLGDIDSEMFHRRMQRQSQSQITDESTTQNMLNPLDRESNTDANNSARVGCRPEYNLQESISNVSPSENISDSDLFGGGVFEPVRTNVADNHCMGTEVRKESPEVKTYNREAGFAFSNFMGNRHSMKTNSTHSGEDLSGSHKAKFDELD